MMIWLTVFGHALIATWAVVLTTALVCLGADAVMNDHWALPLIGTAVAIAAIATLAARVATVSAPRVEADKAAIRRVLEERA